LEKIEEVCERCIYIDHGDVRFDGLSKEAITEYRLALAGIPSKQATVSDGKRDIAAKGKDLNPLPESFQKNVLQSFGKCSIPSDLNREAYFLHIQSKYREISITCGDAIVLEFEIEARVPITETTVGVTITDFRGTPIVGMSSKVQNVPRHTASSRFWKIICNMGSIPLNAGTYFVKIYVGDGKIDHARFNNAFALRVIANDVFGWGEHLPPVEAWGSLFWAPKWTIQPSLPLDSSQIDNPVIE
jgi:hypothetical protein